MILNKSSFKTKIGILYYLWIDSEEGQRIASISTSPGSLKDYIKKISTSRNCLDKIPVNENKGIICPDQFLQVLIRFLYGADNKTVCLSA